MGTAEDWKVDVDVQALQTRVWELECLEANRAEWKWIRLKCIVVLFLVAGLLELASHLLA